MSLKTPYQQEHYSRCDSSSQYRCQTRCDQSRDRCHRDWDRPHYEEREYDTFSRDTGNRGRSLLTTSRSEEHSAAQATFDYSNVRIRDQQAATRSDYSDLLGHSSGSRYASRVTGYRYGTNTTSKVQVFNSTPPNRNPPPGTRKDRISGSATWSFQASVTPAGDIRLVQSRDSSYKGTSGCDRDCRVFTCSGERDFEKHLSDWRSGSWQSPSQGQRDYHNDDYYQCSKKDDYKILFLHTSWSRGQGLGCRPWPSWILSREGTSVVPSRSGWDCPIWWPDCATWLLL